VSQERLIITIFAFTLPGRAKVWMLALPSGTLHTWDESAEFSSKIFSYVKVLGKEISDY